jgi:hypothetical protein
LPQREGPVAAISQLAGSFRDASQADVWVRQKCLPDLSKTFLNVERRPALTGEFLTGNERLPDM